MPTEGRARMPGLTHKTPRVFFLLHAPRHKGTRAMTVLQWFNPPLLSTPLRFENLVRARDGERAYTFSTRGMHPIEGPRKGASSVYTNTKRAPPR